MQYSLPNNHFSRVGCIRRLATERLELNSDKSFLLKTLLYSNIKTVYFPASPLVANSPYQ